MVKIFEMEQQLTNIRNYQSRVGEYESFESYVDHIKQLGHTKDDLIIYDIHVDTENQIVVFLFEREMINGWVEFNHFAQVLN